ncbi:hypothetical protein EDC04DRAFT_2657121 [Pisolithus marmoratus]|nr:hypothetical protein EDC04DRAFT_2657121 [Pisolithus marmoratus]
MALLQSSMPYAKLWQALYTVLVGRVSTTITHPLTTSRPALYQSTPIPSLPQFPTSNNTSRKIIFPTPLYKRPRQPSLATLHRVPLPHHP